MGVDNIFSGVVIHQMNGILQIQSDHTILEAVGSSALGTRVYICLRPEDITLYDSKQEIEPSTARNHISCQITKIINQGSFIRIQLESGFQLTALVTRLSADEMKLEVGKEVIAVIKATAIHLISSGKVHS
jgi:tungstate transport system ATP-binding protein